MSQTVHSIASKLSLKCDIGRGSGLSLVGNDFGQAACTGGQDIPDTGDGFYFQQGGPHCVECFGDNTCQGGTFFFANDSDISFNCDSRIGSQTGGPACSSGSTIIELRGNSCIHLTCARGDDCKDTVIRGTGSNNRRL